MSLTLGHWQALVLLIHGFPLGLWRSFKKPEKAWTSSKPWRFFTSPAFVHTVWRELLFPGVLCFSHPLSKLSQEVLSLHRWASCSNCKCIFQERKVGDALGPHAGWVYQPKETFASRLLCRGGAQRVNSNEIGNLFCSSGIAILWGDKQTLPSHLLWLYNTKDALLQKPPLGYTDGRLRLPGPSSYVKHTEMFSPCSLNPVFVTRFLNELNAGRPRSLPFCLLADHGTWSLFACRRELPHGWGC